MRWWPQRSGRLRLPFGVGRLLLLVGFTVFVAGLGVYQVYAQYQVVTVAYVLDHDRLEHQRLSEIEKRLSLSLSTYKDPTAVRTFAESELDMRVPTSRDEFHVPGDDVVRPRPGPSPPPAGDEEEAP